jgi:ABC-2 type transport system permease protein
MDAQSIEIVQQQRPGQTRRRHIRALAAILRKSFYEFIRYPANFFFSLVMPVIWFLPLYFLILSFAPQGESAGLSAWIGESDFFTYLPLGLMVSYIIMTIFWGMGFALKRLMDIGVLETIWSCPVPRFIHIIGESLFSVARIVVELTIVLTVYRFLYGFTLPPGLYVLLPWVVPFILLIYGFGIGFAALVLLVKDANTMVDTSSFLVMGLTGTQNPPQVFPRFLLAIALAIPITHFVDIMRVETLGIVPLVEPTIEYVVFLSSAVIIPVMGIAFFLWVERRSRRLGNLHVH